MFVAKRAYFDVSATFDLFSRSAEALVGIVSISAFLSAVMLCL